MKRLLLYIQIIVLGIFSTVAPAYAFTLEQRRELELRTFYDPTDGTSCGVGGAVGTFQGLAGKAYMIGDSITEGTNAELNSAFTAKGLSTAIINGKSSRARND